MDMQSARIANDRGGGQIKEAAISASEIIEALIGFARRQRYLLLIVPAIAVFIGLVYMFVTPPQYTATATLLIEGNPLRVLQDQSRTADNTPLDTLQVASQVDVIASDTVALAVIRKLRLTEDPEFEQSGGGLFSSSTDTDTVEDRERSALVRLSNRRSISRIERTYVFDISFTSRSPVTAAKVANAIAEAYIDDQLEAKDQTRRRAGAWLQDRINELGAQVKAADRAVLEFKEKNNIVDLGGSNGAAGSGTSSRLIGEQQLADLNSQLATARGATGEARARLDRIEQVRKMDITEAAVSDTLRDEVITRLRNQYLDLSAREAMLSTRYGADHSAADNIRGQMAELTKNISGELGRIAASYQSDYEIAKAREENLTRELNSLVSEGRVTNRDRLGLSELESSAKIYHDVYDSFFQRYMDAIQQRAFPITDARLISFAAPPSRKSKPRGSLVLTIAAALGVIASLGLAGLREVTDRVFRTGHQVEQELQVKCLAVIPHLQPAASPAPSARRGSRNVIGTQSAKDDQLPATTPSESTHYAFSDPLLRHAADAPLSIFAEAVRAIKVAATLQAAMGDHKVIAVTSMLPNEGKSTVACNLAVLMADAGKRVILLDIDLRNPTLARSLDPRPTSGLAELLDGQVSLQQATGVEPCSRLALLPFVSHEPLAHADEIPFSPAFKDLIDQLRRQYDYIIMDLPPLAPVVDVHAALSVIDSLVLVVEWGRTRISAVQRYLNATPEIRDRLLGVVLNKANLKTMERFELRGLYHDGYYTNRAYRRAS
jgi:exopolysaccharide transport family protein